MEPTSKHTRDENCVFAGLCISLFALLIVLVQFCLSQFVRCRVHLTDDLARIVHDFAEHYHDSWALTKVRVCVPVLLPPTRIYNRPCLSVCLSVC